jgi:hypothetical protein
MVGAGALHQAVFGGAALGGGGPFLKLGFGIVEAQRLDPGHRVGPQDRHHRRRASKARVQIDGGDQRLAGVAEHGVVVPEAALGLATGHTQRGADAELARHLGAFGAADQNVEPLGQVAFVVGGVRLKQRLRHAQPEHPVAQKLQPLVVTHAVDGLSGTGVSQRPLQEVRIGKAVAEGGLQARHGLGADVVALAHVSGWKKRPSSTFRNQVHGLNSEAPCFHENRMISALPTRFSAGTKPTPGCSAFRNGCADAL